MGVAAVDEMDKMQKEDRSALHEAMEQQSISVAKAGITATLKSRCALLGAANPKYGRFDMYGDIADQINMPPSLLSRFDLIFIMTDQPEQKRDLAIAEHILKAHSIGELMAQHKKTPIPGITDEYIQQQLKPVMPDIDPALFRKYVAYAKRNCFPIMSDEAKDTLVNYYLKLRGIAEPNKPVPVTARQLEALVRLGEASARIRLSNTIDMSDAERVIRIVDACLRQIAYDAKTGRLRYRQDRNRYLQGEAGHRPGDQGRDPRYRRRRAPCRNRPGHRDGFVERVLPRQGPGRDRYAPAEWRGDGAEEWDRPAHLRAIPSRKVELKRTNSKDKQRGA